MESKHYLNDLDELITKIDEHRAQMVAACPPVDADPEDIARWEGAFLFVRGFLVEELLPLQRAWKAGEPAFHSTELMLSE